MIRYTNVSKQFGKQTVLNKVSLSLDQPGFCALMGPNGSGKTTLLKIALGLVKPDEGEVEYDGRVLSGDEYRANLSYLAQIARFPENLTPLEFTDLLEQVRGKADRKEELFDRFGMRSFLHKPLRSLSGGMRQKVNIAAALMYDTPVLLLDEPTIGLDPVALLQLKDLLREEVKRGKHVLVTTHILEFVESMADEVVFILDGYVQFRGGLRKLYDATGEPNVERAIALLLKSQSHV